MIGDDVSPPPLVLVACQEPVLRDGLRAALEARGATVRAVVTPRELLITLETHEVSAMVINDDPPIGDAGKLAEAVRRHQLGADVALVVTTPRRWTAARKALAIQQHKLVDVHCSADVAPTQIADLVLAELQRQPPVAILATSGDAFDPLGEAPDSGVVPVDLSEPLADKASHLERLHVEAEAQAASEDAASDAGLLRGALDDSPFPELLHRLYREQATGALFLLKDNIKKIVYFREGHPVYVKSNLLSECLGNVLVREKMITQQECELSLDRMRQTRRQQGTVLIELGCISPQNLVFGLELQLQAKLYDVFGWTTGEFLFKSAAKVPAEVVRIEATNAALIAEGVRRMWDMGRLHRALAPQLSRFLVPAADPELRFQHLPLDEMEEAFVDTIDGTYTLAEHVARSPISDRRAYALAYVLLVTGVVEAREHPARKRRPSQESASSDDVRVRQRLAQELLSLRSRDAFGVLRVAASSSDEEVEQAYSRLARQHHPDRFRNNASETRQMAREIFGLLYDAYKQVDSETRRRDYQDGRAQNPDLQDISEVGRRSQMADQQVKLARRLIDEGGFSEAQAALNEALSLCGDSGDIYAMLGWVTYNLDTASHARLREGIRHLRRAIELDPSFDGAYLYLGRIYAAIGRTILAEKQFERAVQCNPSCAEALEQLQLTKEQRKLRRTGTASQLLKISTDS